MQAQTFRFASARALATDLEHVLLAHAALNAEPDHRHLGRQHRRQVVRHQEGVDGDEHEGGGQEQLPGGGHHGGHHGKPRLPLLGPAAVPGQHLGQRHPEVVVQHLPPAPRHREAPPRSLHVVP